VTETIPGTANLALQMLERGTANRSERQLAEELSLYAIGLGGSAGMDNCQVNMSCLTEHLDKGMDLLADVVLNPSVDAAEFEKLRKHTLKRHRNIWPTRNFHSACSVLILMPAKWKATALTLRN